MRSPLILLLWKFLDFSFSSVLYIPPKKEKISSLNTFLDASRVNSYNIVSYIDLASPG
jgi:hypothetical protein